jgi:hypothetical protein
MRFDMGPIYRLGSEDVKKWIKATLRTVDSAPAGYFGLPQLTVAEQTQKIKAVKDQLTKAMGG